MHPAHSRRSARALAVAAAVALAGPAAQGAPATGSPSPTQLATARELFAQGEHDEDEGRWQDALDKMRQVALVKQTAGIEYHIALCEEHLGLLVSALDDFRQAEAEAGVEHAQDVLRLVGGALDALGSRVPRLSLHVTPEGLEATVTLDGHPLEPTRLGVARPIDPGPHTIEARAPGRQPASITVTMRERDATSLELPLVPQLPQLPQLGQAPAAQALVGAPPMRDGQRPAAAFVWTPARIGGAVATVAAAGLVATGIGAFVAAGNAHERGVQSCATVGDPSPDACASLKNTVRTWDWLAAGAWAGGAVSAGLAVFLWTRTTPASSRAGSLSWSVGVGSVGLRGSF
jgi:hypothetical protein